MKNKRYAAILSASILCCALIALLGLMLGGRFLSPYDIFRILTGADDSVNQGIFFYSRVPRVLSSFLAGAALAVSGAILQNVLSNKLASPGIIGVNAGAGFGVTLCCSLGILSGFAVSAFAFGGALIAVFALSAFAAGTNASKSTVILGGVALNSILGAFSESLAVLDSDVAMLTTEFRIGGFSSVSYTSLLPAAIMIIASLLVMFTLFNELDVVTLGDETAASVGLKVRFYRILFLVIAALLAGAAVSFAGLLGFVGLIVPHFVRRISGSESRRLIPLSALIGGGFVCLSDILARVLFTPYELPVGILMAVVGGPLFVVMLVRMKGRYRE